MTSDTRRGFLAGAATAAAASGSSIISSSSTMAQAPAAPASVAADLILKNGKVITVDSAFTIAQAVAIAGDCILAKTVSQDCALTA